MLRLDTLSGRVCLECVACHSLVRVSSYADPYTKPSELILYTFSVYARRAPTVHSGIGWVHSERRAH
jgi:hypothetical protein